MERYGNVWHGKMVTKRWRVCEVSCETPMWPSAPRWQSAHQTNCFGWQCAARTTWSRTLEQGNSCSLLPFGPLQRISDFTVVWERWDEAEDLLSFPLTFWTCSSLPAAVHSRGNFTTAFQLLNCFRASFSKNPSASVFKLKSGQVLP